MDIEFIKNPVEAYQQLIKENEELRIKYAGCKTANTAIQQENAELKEALEEIRNIVKPCFDGDDCTKCEEDCFNKDVLKIVNEVL